MSIYDELSSEIPSIMSEFKQGEVNLIVVTPANGPVDNPGTPTETSHTLNATVQGVNFKYVQSGLAVSSDLIVTSAVVEGVTPSEKDFISIDGTRHKIVQDMSVPSAGIKLVWKFIVRKGG